MIENDKGITQYLGVNLAELLSEKIRFIYNHFSMIKITKVFR